MADINIKNTVEEAIEIADTEEDKEVASAPKKRVRKATPKTETGESAASETVTEKKTKKTYKATDGIPCKSIMTGKTFVQGIKTKDLYRFEYQNDVQDIAYQDLIAAIKSKANCLFKPTIVVLDEEFIEQNKVLSDFYTSFYTKDLNKIFNMKPRELEKTLRSLPVGAQNAVKSMATTKIANGTFDSVQKIKVFDKVFNTKMMLLTGLYDN